MAKTRGSKKAWSKSELIRRMADDTGLSKKDVSAVLDSISDQIERSLGRRGPGVFTLPGLIKIEKKRVPARKARKGVPNPFKPGELMDIAAKPSTTKVKIRPLKKLTEIPPPSAKAK